MKSQVTKLSRFSIIVAVDSKNGIAKNNQIPWKSSQDLLFFKNKTLGLGNNAVIMGRLTYQSIPLKCRPLKGRDCIVLSNTMKDKKVTVCNTLLNALICTGNSHKQYSKVYIAGGERVYKEAIERFGYLCDSIYITIFDHNYKCDKFFPYTIKDFDMVYRIGKNTNKILLNIVHEEYKYLGVVKDILENGETRKDRTGTGTKSKFGIKMEFDISNSLPLLTTKKVFHRMIIKELLFFISGKTNTKILEKERVNIWKGNTSKEFLKKKGLNYKEGDMGPLYGFQWRHWGAKYEGCDKDYSGKGIDQLSNLIEQIKNNPYSRRHILTSWNVGQLDQMVLPPCHMMCQFYVSNDGKYLDCQLYQRSGDMFLGVPFNIACYSILTYIIAHVTGLKPRKLIHIIGDAHIYLNHIDQTKKQLERTPRPFPILKLVNIDKVKTIDDFVLDNFKVEGYECCPYIKAKVSV